MKASGFIQEIVQSSTQCTVTCDFGLSVVQCCSSSVCHRCRTGDTVLGCCGFHGDCLTVTKELAARVQVGTLHNCKSGTLHNCKSGTLHNCKSGTLHNCKSVCMK